MPLYVVMDATRSVKPYLHGFEVRFLPAAPLSAATARVLSP